jgi:predicted ATPase
MLTYLTVLYDPDPPQLIGIEESENQLHPRLLRGLAEECRRALLGDLWMEGHFDVGDPLVNAVD